MNAISGVSTSKSAFTPNLASKSSKTALAKRTLNSSMTTTTTYCNIHYIKVCDSVKLVDIAIYITFVIYVFFPI